MTTRRITRFVDALLRNRRPRHFAPDTEDIAAMRAAIELTAAQPGASLPSSAFVAELHQRLAEQDAEQRADERDASEVMAPPRFTRRRLIEGLATAAAAATAGILIDQELLTSTGGTPRAVGRQIVPNRGSWRAVTTSAQLADTEVVPFRTPATVGFVVRDGDALAAVSGVCTHQGCTLQHNEAEGRLDCPCHRTSFSLRGDVLNQQFAEPLPPLPHLPVRQRNGTIEVFSAD
jgi:nitrite reductase/ring-hydroxylating ferredoxin subunit